MSPSQCEDEQKAGAYIREVSDLLVSRPLQRSFTLRPSTGLFEMLGFLQRFMCGSLKLAQRAARGLSWPDKNGLEFVQAGARHGLAQFTQPFLRDGGVA